jgi:pseudouridine kinase
LGRPLVIGASCLDFKGRAREALVLGTSNIGSIARRPGGVGFNIAAHLALLGAAPRFVSMVGNDPEGSILLAACRECELETEHVRVVDEPTGVYLAVLDPRGELAAGIAAMDLCEAMLPGALPSLEPLVMDAPMVIVDANLPLPTLAHVAGLCSVLEVPLWAEPATADKARRLLDILPVIALLKPNREELEALVGLPLPTRAEIVDAARGLGVRSVIVTLAEEGVVRVDGDRAVHYPSPVVEVRDATGAGDALMAAMAWAAIRGRDLDEGIACGIEAARLTLQSDESVPRGILAVLEKRG